MEQHSEYETLVRSLLGQEVEVIIDRPLGSRHPKHPNILYHVNYGYLTAFKAPDGDYQDAYVLGPLEAVSRFHGVAIAIIHRLDDNEDKLVVTPKGKNFTDQEIEEAVEFQEKYFKHVLIR